MVTLVIDNRLGCSAQHVDICWKSLSHLSAHKITCPACPVQHAQAWWKAVHYTYRPTVNPSGALLAYAAALVLPDETESVEVACMAPPRQLPDVKHSDWAVTRLVKAIAP